MTTARTETSTAAKAGSQTKIACFRLLDFLQSFWNLSWKTLASRQRWGKEWHDKVRTGRRYTRVEYRYFGDSEGYWRIRPEPGWEWTCQNCKTYSIVLRSLVAVWHVDNQEIRTNLFLEWQDLALKTAARGFNPPARPTPETAGCPNCKYRPGAPE